MRIAFHPLNAPDDGNISGDRRMAGQLVAALRQLGHTVEPVADARAYLKLPEPALLHDLQARQRARAAALLAGWSRAAAAPELWFTYHSYYKAPDLLGPGIAAALAIPYVVAEASDSERRAAAPGPSMSHWRATFCAADLHLCFTARDRRGIETLCGTHSRYLDLPPFIAEAGPEPARPRQDGEPPRLITVAMMRDGVKHESYLALARVLAALADRPWRLTVIGDGARRAEVEHAFAGLPAARLDWRGALGHDAVAAALREHDVFVWPGIGEAYGLVYLEAQAAGLPVVAFASGGVPSTVEPGRTALLAPEGDEAALAQALAGLLASAPLRRRMGAAARRFVAGGRTLTGACAILAGGLARVTAAGRMPGCGAP